MASQEAKPHNYRTLFPLARGGLGEVSLVLRSEGDFKRLYAMKRLHRRFAFDEEVNRMFLAEARLAGLLRHANIVSVLDVGRDHEGPFLVMELVEGITVADLLKKHAESAELIPLAMVVEIVMQACRGLNALHRLKALDGSPLHIVHRDVSPQNLLLGYDGAVQLTDFGIAKDLSGGPHTTTGVLRGKTGYMSPEQVRMEPLSFRSDLFSLGVVLWELLTGVRLYRAADSEKSPARQIMEDAPADPIEFRSDLPPELSEVVFDLLAKEPQHRPESARSVVERLSGILSMMDRQGEDLSLFVSEVFSVEKAAFAREVQEALEATTLMPSKRNAPAQLETTEPEATKQKRTKFWASLAAASLLGVSALVFFAQSSGSAAENEPLETLPDNVGTANTVEEPSTLEPREEPEVAVEGTIVEPVEVEPAEVEPEEPELEAEADVSVETVRRRRRGRARRRSAMQTMQTTRSSRMSDDDTWWEP